MKTLCVALSLTLFSLPALAQDSVPTGTCVYQKLPVDNLSTPSGINDVGGIVGSVFSRTDSTTHAFLLFNGKMTLFRFPGSSFSTASSINNHAQIVGSTFFIGARDIRGYVVRDGTFHLIVVPNSEGNDAADINDNGDIVGNVTTNDEVAKGYLLHNGTFHIFRFPGSAETHVTGINRDGIIVGNYRSAVVNSPIHGFMVKNGIFTTLDFPGAQFTFPNKINNEGEIIGFYEGEALAHRFSFDKGKFQELNDPSNTQQSSPTGLNNHDQIVTAAGFKGDCHAVF
jgi:probable HAF family extracellular repeat protein